MKKVMNIVATIWEYEKDWEAKKEYMTVGKLFVRDNGQVSIKMNATPINWNWWYNVYPIEKKHDNQSEWAPF